MDYNLIREIIDLLTDFEKSCNEGNKYPITKEGFIAWISENYIYTFETKKGEEQIK
ncbi:hypothetical protein LUD75_07105 [Epilithonimonas sp. JDS]|uniref:hypothetical protein n=1 Tax=Epilithonimonas sp. JDS TaxID=2902797 RepID=UPI001E47A11E|nr:hypothetical protein [Epilithonimonas sp. JDS]MCD9854467.1 hypothetical protein [Epilithonimonas sp. JDS]